MLYNVYNVHDICYLYVIHMYIYINYRYTPYLFSLAQQLFKIQYVRVTAVTNDGFTATRWLKFA